MKQLAHRFFVAAAAVLVTTAAGSAPLNVPGALQQSSGIDQVRLVCDQDCHCWPTRYVKPRHSRKIDDRERQDPNYCPAGGHYNGYYRAGPGIGLSFESRLPVRAFPFPF